MNLWKEELSAASIPRLALLGGILHRLLVVALKALKEITPKGSLTPQRISSGMYPFLSKTGN